MNKRLYLANTEETGVLLILLKGRQYSSKTISCKDNKAYKLARPNNNKKGTIGGGTIMEYTKTIA